MVTAQYAGVWNLGLEIGDFGQNETGNKRLAELMKNFGCGDEIAPLDADAFGRRMGAVIAQAVSAPRPRLESEVAASTNAPELRSRLERNPLVNALTHVPRSDRLTLLATAVVSAASLLIAAGTVLFE